LRGQTGVDVDGWIIDVGRSLTAELVTNQTKQKIPTITRVGGDGRWMKSSEILRDVVGFSLHDLYGSMVPRDARKSPTCRPRLIFLKVFDPAVIDRKL
jgi:hypothetical protein